jgi:hypoxanthine phosphoribosyltransferase
MKTLLNPHQIRMGILKIVEKIMLRHNVDEPIVMIGVMRGGFMFYADLMQELQRMNIICDFVNCASYTGTENTGFKMLLDSRVDVTDKHVYLIDDILDSGITYEYLKIHYEYKGAKSVEGIFALKKYDEKYREEMCIMSVPKENNDFWYIGYGMDDENGGSRHLKTIYYK